MMLQGIVLMVAGVFIVALFLGLLVVVLTVSAKVIPRFNHILPDDPPKTRIPKAQGKKVKSRHESDAEIAISLAAVSAHQRNG